MILFWKRTQRRALMCEPTDEALQAYLECFSVGYARGQNDASTLNRAADLTKVFTEIAQRVASYRSMLEGACWLAGARQGYLDARSANSGGRKLYSIFSECWDTGVVADCAIECGSAISLRNLFVATCQPRHVSIRERVVVKFRLNEPCGTSRGNPARMRTARLRPE